MQSKIHRVFEVSRWDSSQIPIFSEVDLVMLSVSAYYNSESSTEFSTWSYPITNFFYRNPLTLKNRIMGLLETARCPNQVNSSNKLEK